MNAWAAWGLSAMLVAGAWALVTNVPDDVHETDAIVAPVTADGLAIGRTIAVSVASVSETRSVVSDDWASGGRWIVVEVAAHVVHDERDRAAELGMVMLHIDGKTYTASTKVPTVAREVRLLLDVPTRTSLAFQIPDDLSTTDMSLEIWGSPGYPSLDSAITFDLDDPEPRERVELVFGEVAW